LPRQVRQPPYPARLFCGHALGRAHAGGKLKEMVVLKRGNRLSITPVTKSEWQFIESLAGK